MMTERPLVEDNPRRGARELAGIATCPRLAPVPNWSVRIPALDGLRGIAILLVLLRHSLFGMPTNSRFLAKILAAGQLTWSGVDLFFVLSGFLIGGILLDARESPRYFQTFYIRRAYRILPLYLAITLFFLMRHLLSPGASGRLRGGFAAYDSLVVVCDADAEFLDGSPGLVRRNRDGCHVVLGGRGAVLPDDPLRDPQNSPNTAVVHARRGCAGGTLVENPGAPHFYTR